MGTIDEIKRMREQGNSDEQIKSELKRMGLSNNEISSVISQSQIKDAVQNYHEDEIIGQYPSKPQTQEISEEGMQPSLMAQEPQENNQQYQEQPQQEYQIQQPYPEQQYEYEPYPSYPDQYQYQSLSTDTINEIAEQAITERIAPIKNQIEKVLDTKNTFASQIENISTRLQRIEKIIDRLQISILQKVGDYVTNVEDIKKELVQTQKTFKAISKKPSRKP